MQPQLSDGPRSTQSWHSSRRITLESLCTSMFRVCFFLLTFAFSSIFMSGRNGDANFPGISVVLDPRQIRVWSMLLDHITARIDNREGAVRRLFLLPSGKEVCERGKKNSVVCGHPSKSRVQVTELSELSNGLEFAASAQGGFKRLDYDLIEDINTKRRNYKPPVRPLSDVP